MADSDYAAEFPQREDIAYLNHAGIGPWPKRSADAVEAFARENVCQGAAGYRNWLQVEALLRSQLQALINAPSPDDIALLKNTSEALSIVAYGLDWRNGDNVIISDQEFPSNRIVWQSLSRLGVSVRQAPLYEADSPEAALMAACDDKTRLIAISSVQYGTGLRMHLEPLGRFCRSAGVLLCVDAIQSLGAFPMDVQEIQADFVMADGHKWMLGPEGVAVLYCRRELRDRLSLFQYGWHMVEDHLNFDRKDWQVASSARRFECGSSNMTGIHALSASLSLLLEVGLDSISRNVLNNTYYLSDKLENLSRVRVISPALPERRSGIVTFRMEGSDIPSLFKQLSNRGIICALRGGGIRFSPHFYTPRFKLDAALNAVQAFTG